MRMDDEIDEQSEEGENHMRRGMTSSFTLMTYMVPPCCMCLLLFFNHRIRLLQKRFRKEYPDT